MPGRLWKPFAALLVGSLLTVFFSTPACALDCVKKAANRTGAPQQEQVVTLAGAELVEDLLTGELYASAQQLFGPVFTTVIRFFSHPGGAVPPTQDPDPPSASVVRTGFSVADHEFILLGWTWGATPATPTVPIADPSVSIRRLSGNQVLVQLVNTTGRPVLIANLRILESPFRPGIENEVMDPLYPPGVIPPFVTVPPGAGGQIGALSNGNGNNGNEDIPPPETRPRAEPPSEPDREMTSTMPVNASYDRPLTEPINLLLMDMAEIMVQTSSTNPETGIAVKGSVLDGMGAMSQAQAVALGGVRSAQATPGTMTPLDSVSWLVRGQPFQTYDPAGFGIQATPPILIPATGQLVPVEVVVYALDPDSSRDASRRSPTITLEGVTAPGDALFDPSDVVFNPATGISSTQITDPAGRQVTCATARLMLRSETAGRGRIRFYNIRFRLRDDQGEDATATAIVEVRPPGAPQGLRQP